MIHFTVLGSGSSGNCAVVSNGEVTVLVDAGLSAKQIRLRLEAAGYAAGDLSGILLTHEHGDHVRGLDVLCRQWPVPVYCTPLTRECLAGSLKEPKRWKLAATGAEFRLGSLVVRSFPVPHDAVDPVGFVFEDRESRLGMVSDVGYVTNVMRDNLRGSSALFIEANYDEVMLQNDVKRPWSTKQRISARHGHLSNDQAAELLREVATERLHRVVLGHLSEDCNDPEVARGTARRALAGEGLDRVEVDCAHRDRPTARFAAAAPGGASVAHPGGSVAGLRPQPVSPAVRGSQASSRIRDGGAGIQAEWPF